MVCCGSMKNVKTIGIDYGTKKVGIALSDENGRIAFPYGVIPNTGLFDAIKTLCEKEHIGAIVVGESRDFEGKHNPVMKKILPFKKKLEDALSLPVVLEPEFLTSKQARNIQEDSITTDASAAALILQSYLDKKQN